MKQSKKMSLAETVVSTIAGFMVSLVLVNVVLPFYGYNVRFGQSVEIVIVFTVASIARGYLVRRVFEGIRC